MTCRCKTTEEHAQRAIANIKAAQASETNSLKKRLKEAEESLVDANQFTIEKAEQVGCFLVMIVQYPSCPKCTYEGYKLMVFPETYAIDALKWKKIDPHFRDSGKENSYEAPSPVARFPATEEGWNDAVAYAQSKTGIPAKW